MDEKTEAQRDEQKLVLLGRFDLRPSDATVHQTLGPGEVHSLWIIRKLVPAPSGPLGSVPPSIGELPQAFLPVGLPSPTSWAEPQYWARRGPITWANFIKMCARLGRLMIIFSPGSCLFGLGFARLISSLN